VDLTDPGCQSGRAGEFNSMHFAACSNNDKRKSKPELWAATGSWPKVHEMLRDVASYDFRPIPHGRLVNAAKPDVGLGEPHLASIEALTDIGAYAASETHYSIPGRILASASSPVPPVGASSVQTTADLMFLGGAHAEAHDVFISQDFCTIALAEVGTARQKATCAEQRLSSPQNIHSPGQTLFEGATYFWRVDAVLDHGTISRGEVWCFRVEQIAADHSIDRPWNLITQRDQCMERKVSECAETAVPNEAPCGPAAIPMPTTTTTKGPCRDHAEWHTSEGNKFDCRWVGAKAPRKLEQRCTKTSEEGVSGWQACPLTCGTCDQYWYNTGE